MDIINIQKKKNRRKIKMVFGKKPKKGNPDEVTKMDWVDKDELASNLASVGTLVPELPTEPVTSLGVFESKWQKDRKKEHALLRNTPGSDLIVVGPGGMDSIETVFEILHVPYDLIMPTQLASRDLTAQKAMFVNCPGRGLEPHDRKRIKEFVGHGGLLVTSDWAVLNLLQTQEMFPDKIKHSGVKTSNNEGVGLYLANEDQARLIGIEGVKDPNPVWFLENSSYPIDIIDKDNVDILLQSHEMKRKYKSPYIAVGFNYGEGRVLHFVSHFKLQGNYPKDKRHNKSIVDFTRELGVEKNVDWDHVNLATKLGQIESSYTAMSVLASIIAEHRDSQPKESLDVLLKPVYGDHVEIGVPEGAQIQDYSFRLGIDAAGVTFGRSEKSGIYIKGDEEISATHALFYFSQGNLMLMDMGSTNGTFLNNTRMEPNSPKEVDSGSKVKMGKGWVEANY